MHKPYRPLGKQEMARIPLFGFFYRRFVVTVDRNNGISRSKSFIDLKGVLDQKLSVFIFPEGTFNESENPLSRFYSGPFQLALKKSINIRPVVFADSLDRMHFSNIFAMRPGICRAVFLEEIDIDDYLPGKLSELKEDVYARMNQVLRKYNNYYEQNE